jgi:hypothetical protein
MKPSGRQNQWLVCLENLQQEVGHLEQVELLVEHLPHKVGLSVEHPQQQADHLVHPVKWEVRLHKEVHCLSRLCKLVKQVSSLV